MTNATKRERKTYTRDLGDGATLRANVSPCVFMYAGYPLQITVTLQRHPGEELGEAYAYDLSQKADTDTHADVESLLAVVRVVPCRRCATPAFDAATVQTTRDGRCESCFRADLNAGLPATYESVAEEIADHDTVVT